MAGGERDAELVELVQTLKHDLAKYVAWRSSNYPDEAWTGPLREDFATSLQSDVLRTLGGEPAWEIFARHVPKDRSVAELNEVAAAVDRLRACERALRAGGDDLARARSTIRAAQTTIRSQLRAVLRKLRS